jgi:hypothetical protein
MSELNYMDREELLKLAALDVFGLLDEYEAELYNRSFHDAPASVQDEVASLQAEIAADPVFQSEERPIASLRERVLERVARAVEVEAAKLAPIATIGRGRRPAQPDPVHVRSLRRSAMIWRAVSFSLAACVVIVVGLFLQATREGTEILRLAINEHTRDQLRDRVGPDLEYFIKNATARDVLRPASGSDSVAEVWINERTGQAFVVGLGLIEGEYAVRVRANAAGPIDVGHLSSDGTICGDRVEDVDLLALGVASLTALTWEIVDGSGQVILTTA